jgi:hypothetical protein
VFFSVIHESKKGTAASTSRPAKSLFLATLFLTRAHSPSRRPHRPLQTQLPHRIPSLPHGSAPDPVLHHWPWPHHPPSHLCPILPRHLAHLPTHWPRHDRVQTCPACPTHPLRLLHSRPPNLHQPMTTRPPPRSHRPGPILLVLTDLPRTAPPLPCRHVSLHSRPKQKW